MSNRRYDFGRAVSRILSAPKKSGERIICLSSRYPRPVPPRRDAERAAPGSPIWPCTGWGFPCPAGCPAGGKLLPHLFTLTPLLRMGRFAFLWHFPSKCLEAFLPRVSARRGAAGVTRHRALWCSDFPPPPRLRGTEAILRPSKIGVNITAQGRLVNGGGREIGRIGRMGLMQRPWANAPKCGGRRPPLQGQSITARSMSLV